MHSFITVSFYSQTLNILRSELVFCKYGLSEARVITKTNKMYKDCFFFFFLSHSSKRTQGIDVQGYVTSVTISLQLRVGKKLTLIGLDKSKTTTLPLMDRESFMLPGYPDVLVADEISCGILNVLQNTLCLPQVQWKKYTKDKISDTLAKLVRWYH